MKQDEIFTKALNYYSYKILAISAIKFIRENKQTFFEQLSSVNLPRKNISCVFSNYIYIPIVHVLNPIA